MLILESVSHVAQASASLPEAGTVGSAQTPPEAGLSGLRHVSSILSLSHHLCSLSHAGCSYSTPAVSLSLLSIIKAWAI